MNAEDFKDRVAQLMEGRTEDWMVAKRFAARDDYMIGWWFALSVNGSCVAIYDDAEQVLAELTAWLAEHPQQPSPWDGVAMEGVTP